MGTTANDLCSATANPCRVSSTINVTPGSEIDVGSRQLLIANRGALNLTSGTMTLRAGTLTVESGGSLLGRRGTNEPGGRIIAVAGSMNIAGTVDVSSGPGGTITLTSDRALMVSGLLDARSRSGEAGGGSISLQGQDVTISTGARVTAVGGASDAGGDVTIRAAGGLTVNGELNTSGGDGGSIDLRASGTLTIGQITLNADATAVAGGGGSIDASTIGNVVIQGILTAAGRNGTATDGGGDGGTISIIGGTIDVSLTGARLIVNAGGPDGLGGDVDLTSTTGRVSVRGQVLARSPGAEGIGGSISVDAAGEASVTGTLDASGGSGGGGDIDVTSGLGTTIPSGASITVAASSTGTGGSIDVAGNGLVAIGGNLVADGGNAQAAGGAIEVSGCTVHIEASGRLSSFRPNGINVVIGRDLAVIGGTMRADPSGGRNRALFAGAGYEPAILPGSQISPPIALVVDPSVVPCNPIDTPTPTVTATGGTPTPTFTPRPNGCVGDCNGSGDVVVSELVVGVNIALGNQPIANCPAFDANGDGMVTVNELVQGVNNALNGCPA